jgi:hypothetical protein
MPEFRYIAFDQDSLVALAHDARAAYALQRADRLNGDARIYIIDAGALALQIWIDGLTLPEAEAFILQTMRQKLRVLEEQE